MTEKIESGSALPANQAAARSFGVVNPTSGRTLRLLFTPDSSHLVAAVAGEPVRVFRYCKPDELGREDHPGVIPSHGGLNAGWWREIFDSKQYFANVSALAISPDGRLFTGANNGNVQFSNGLLRKTSNHFLFPSDVTQVGEASHDTLLARINDQDTSLWTLGDWQEEKTHDLRRPLDPPDWSMSPMATGERESKG